MLEGRYRNLVASGMRAMRGEVALGSQRLYRTLLTFLKAALTLSMMSIFFVVGTANMPGGDTRFPKPFTKELLLESPPMQAANMPVGDARFPKPFTKELYLDFPPMQGKDVVILQNLLLRSPYVTDLTKTGFYDKRTFEAVACFQKANDLPRTGVFDARTASLVLQQLLYDGYKDDGKVPAGYKFKILVPVYKDRRIETTATLFDSNNKPLYKFIARCHGGMDSTTERPLNQLTKNGNTPTGLVTFDLNSPEPDQKSFGPYPVIRAVKGLKGNAAIGLNKTDTYISDYRSGILLHTGEWSNWNSTMPMPNSDGCIHVHPTDLNEIDKILETDLGVVVNPNPFREKPYPYSPQGLFLGCIHAHPKDMKRIDEILRELGAVARPNTLGKLPYPYKPQGILSVEEVVMHQSESTALV